MSDLEQEGGMGTEEIEASEDGVRHLLENADHP